MRTIKPPSDFHAGTVCSGFITCLKNELKKYHKEQFCLDLSEVVFMDSFSFRAVFDYLPKFSTVIPPNDPLIIDLYNMYLDSKKCLSKNFNPNT